VEAEKPAEFGPDEDLGLMLKVQQTSVVAIGMILVAVVFFVEVVVEVDIGTVVVAENFV